MLLRAPGQGYTRLRSTLSNVGRNDFMHKPWSLPVHNYSGEDGVGSAARAVPTGMDKRSLVLAQDGR